MAGHGSLLDDGVGRGLCVCAEEGRREEGGEDRWAVRDGVWHTRRQAARWALEPGLAPRRVIHAWHGSLTNYDVRPPD